MSRNERKYKKLFRDLGFYRSEIDYQNEVLVELHLEFDLYYHEFCSEKGINIDKLNQEKTCNEEEHAAVCRGFFKKDKKEDIPKVFSKIYKSIATKLHPDKFPHATEAEKEAKAESFKKLSLFFETQDWANLIKMAEEEKIDFLISNELIAFMKKEVNYIKEQIKNNETKFSWQFYNCEDNEGCKESLMKQFLKQVHKLEIT